MGDRLVVGGSLECSLAGEQPMRHGALGQPSVGEVVGDDLWVDRRGNAAPLLHRLGDRPMVGLAGGLQQ